MGDEVGTKFNAQVLGVGFDYPLSKRTSVYTGASWAKGGKALDKKYGYAVDVNGYQFGFGIKHTF